MQSIWKQGETIEIKYVKQDGLAWLCLKNALLKIITLGIYGFWAKTNVRKHIWESVHINANPLAYNGTGLELFLSALLVTLTIFTPLAIIYELNIVIIFITPPILYILYGAGLYSARNYRLSRTIWRGIRGGMNGYRFQYGIAYLAATLAKIITLGWATPAANMWLIAKLRNETEIGHKNLQFNIKITPLYPPFAIAYILFIILAAITTTIFVTFLAIIEIEDYNAYLIGTIILLFPIYIICALIYKTAEIRHMMKCTSWKGANLSINVTYLSLLALHIKTILIRILTLSVATPYAQQMIMQYYCDRLHVNGKINLENILQTAQERPTTGEGMAAAFDVDVLGGIF